MTLDDFLLERLGEAAETPNVVEAKARVVEGARRWAAEHDVPLEQTPQYPTLRFMATRYAEHPDYAEEWSRNEGG